MTQEKRLRLGRPYPPYTEPAKFPDVGCYEMTPEMAQEHFEWYTTSYFERVEVLLKYFEENLTEDPVADLTRLGGHVERVMRRDKQLKVWKKGEIIELRPGCRGRESPAWQLTNAGWVLAQDMGLLLAHELLALNSPFVRWAVWQQPKNDPSFQRPVITWHRNRCYDPMLDSQRICLSIIDRSGDGTTWARYYTDTVKAIAEHERLIELKRQEREREKEERRLARQLERERLKKETQGMPKTKKG